MDGRPVPLYGDGGNVRDWLHVSDHCAGIQLALEKGRAGEIYNIGGGLELTNKELTARLLEACGAGWDMVEPVTDRKGHDRRYSLDITKVGAGSGLRPGGRLRRGAGRHGRLVPGQPRLVGAAQGPGGARRMTVRWLVTGAGGMLGRDLVAVLTLDARRAPVGSDAGGP